MIPARVLAGSGGGGSAGGGSRSGGGGSRSGGGNRGRLLTAVTSRLRAPMLKPIPFNTELIKKLTH
jgi:hypothetical protein